MSFDKSGHVMAEQTDHNEMSALTPGPTPPPAVLSDDPVEQQHLAVRTGSRLVDLLTGTARVGVSASMLAAGEITNQSVKLARVVLPTGMAAGVLDTIERQVRGREDEARRSEQQGLGDVTSAAESVLNRVVVEIVDMLDMEQLIDHVPIDRVVARIDLPAVIDQIDLTGVVRQATTGLGGESIDGIRSGLMTIDEWSARFVDKILRRKKPRDLDIHTTTTTPLETRTLEVLP
jgi:hypothetical protein